MVRAPCCERTGLKKGPWTAEEDQILVSYIRRFGHANWRALPKHAGLLRCGKSCRLRWMNYLRPDIKRGNFSAEEEDAIISLHSLLGNKWSAIAAQLPGRTDNEIKNVWHTDLKKRVKPKALESPQMSCSELSSLSADDSSTLTAGASTAGDHAEIMPELLGMDDDDWWPQSLTLEDQSVVALEFSGPSFSFQPSDGRTEASSGEDSHDFWMRVLLEAGGMPELPGFS